MKIHLVSKTAGLSAGLLVSFLLSSSSFAGPGPQYWEQQAKARASAVKAQPATPAAAHDHGAAIACPSCKSTTIEEFSATNVSGKIATRYTAVGSKHECVACGGAIATVRGKTTDDMKANCPICAKAKASGGGIL